MEQLSNKIDDTNCFKLKRISWSAIFAGVIVAIILQLLFSLLGIGIGLSNFSPTTDAHPFQGFGTGATIWWFISILISLFAGGWVSGWLNNTTEKMDNALHGVMTWGIFALFSLYIVTSSVGNIVGGMGHVLGKSLNTAGNVIKDISPNAANLVGDQLGLNNDDLEKLKNEALTLLRQSGKKELQPENIDKKYNEVRNEIEGSGEKLVTDPTNANQDAQSLINKLFNLKEDILSAADQDALANIISQRTGKTKQESKEIVANWAEAADQTKRQIEQTVEKAKQEGKKLSDEASDALGKAAILGFFALLLGAALSITGSLVANKQRLLKVR